MEIWWNEVVSFRRKKFPHLCQLQFFSLSIRNLKFLKRIWDDRRSFSMPGVREFSILKSLHWIRLIANNCFRPWDEIWMTLLVTWKTSVLFNVEKMLTSRWVTLDTLVTNDDGLDYYWPKRLCIRWRTWPEPRSSLVGIHFEIKPPSIQTAANLMSVD